MYVRKVDQPALHEAVCSALLAVSPQVEELRDSLWGAFERLLASDLPDRLVPQARRDLMNEIARRLFDVIELPLFAPGE
jgi:hypothetical protein